MKICKFCGNIMQSEFETNRFDFHRRRGFHVCLNCGAVCDDDITEKGNNKVVHSEKWYDPTTEKEKN